MIKKEEDGEGEGEGGKPLSFRLRQSVHTALISRIRNITFEEWIQKKKSKNRITTSHLLHELELMSSNSVGIMVGVEVRRVGCLVGAALGQREGCTLGCPLGCEG